MSGIELDTGSVAVGDQGYYLPKHVYACQTDEGIVFLDAKRDRYFGLGGAGAAGLPGLIKNWTGPALHVRGASEIPIFQLEVQHVADNLVRRGLLGRCDDGGDLSHHSSAPPLAMDLPPSVMEAQQAFRLIDLLYFAVACIQSLWLLRRLPLQVIASRVTAARHNEKSLDLVDVFARVQVFRKLRRLIFSEKDRCLLNALALVLFLRHYGYFPLFVIGVKTRPFAAHSWVQHEQVLLDGDPASVCHFVPILVA